MSEAGVATDARVATYAEESRPSEERKESPQNRARHTGHDSWGSCCSNCEHYGQAYKPCAVCTDWKRALR